MDRTREEIFEQRRLLKMEYRDLYVDVADLLFRHDPIGINFETNTDEYEPEVETILPRLGTCRSVDDVRQVVHEEFVRWFDADIAGPADRYADIAAEIWERWQRFNAG
jgi:hypothetical protein